MRTLHMQGYLFLCSNLTVKECFDKKLFGITEPHWGDVTTLIAFPIDVHGLEWRALSPAWVWAKGKRKQSEYGEMLTTLVKEIEDKNCLFYREVSKW